MRTQAQAQAQVTETTDPETKVVAIRKTLEPLLAAFERDMGTALGAVLGHAELLSMHANGGAPHERDALGYVHMFSQLAKELLEAYMDVQRLSLGLKQLTLASVDAVRLVQHAVRGASFEAREAGVELELGALPDVELLADVRALDKTMRSVLRALFEIAGPGGRVLVRSALQPVDTPLLEQGRLRVTFVVDGAAGNTGAIASEVLLSAWRAIVELHGGELCIERFPLRVHVIVPHVETPS